MKSLVFVAAALVHDLRRRAVPLTALAVGLAYWAASLVSAVLKEVIGRQRPQDGNLIARPDTDAFPSGHATTAFAAAVALSLLVPAARWWALPLAAIVAYSRVHLGVHHPTDVVGGAVIGALVGVAVVALSRPRSAHAGSPRTRPR